MFECPVVLPPTLWPALAGGALTLAGVLIADFRNSRRQRLQHLFDADQKKLDRIVSLRRELYAPMADVIKEAISFLITPPKIKIVDKKLQDDFDITNPLGKLNSATAKLLIIAEPNTAILAQHLDLKFSEVRSKLIDAARPLKLAMTAAAASSILKDERDKDFDRVSAALDLHRESGKGRDHTWKALAETQKEYLKEFEEAEEQYHQLLKAEMAEKIRYLKLVHELSPEIEDLSLRLLVSMRSELTGLSDGSTLADELLGNIRQERKRLTEKFEIETNNIDNQ